jgi:hypothetical protein
VQRGHSDSKGIKLFDSPQKSLFTSDRVIAPSGLHLMERSLRNTVKKRRQTEKAILDKILKKTNYFKVIRAMRGK